MSVQEQFKKIKENWLIVLFLVLIIGIFVAGPSNVKDLSFLKGGAQGYFDMDESYSSAVMMEKTAFRGGVPYSMTENFAPEIEERKITKNANLNTKVKKGFFKEAENKVKNIIKSSDSFILNENVHKYGNNRKEYYQGNYRIKVETDKYYSVISQLKEIGEIKSFSENMDDITGVYNNKEVELSAEKSRLEKYKQIYEESKTAEEKMEVSDRIFNLERTIKYYENSLKNMDKKIDYSEIYMSIQEEQSEYVDLIFVKFSQLLKSLVNSINGLLNFIFVILPYIVVIGMIILIVRHRKKNKSKRK